jgi:hypothetical protein
LIALCEDSPQHARLASRIRALTPNQAALLEIVAIAIGRAAI